LKLFTIKVIHNLDKEVFDSAVCHSLSWRSMGCLRYSDKLDPLWNAAIGSEVCSGESAAAFTWRCFRLSMPGIWTW